MRPTTVLLAIVVILLGVLIARLNMQPHEIKVAMFTIRASVGVMIGSAFGLGFFTGLIAVLTRDVPRMRRLKDLGADDD